MPAETDWSPVMAELRQSWPDCDEPTVRAWLNEAFPQGVDDAFVVVDWVLAQRCLRRDDLALAEFERVLAQAAPVLRRCVHSQADLDEFVQLTRLKLLAGEAPRLREYAGRGSLVAWVRTVAVRLTLNELKIRARRAELMPHEQDPVMGFEAGLDPVLAVFMQSHQETFAEALRAAWKTLPANLRVAMRMSVLDRQSIDRIAAVLGTHRATAARWLERARAMLLEETRTVLAQRLGMAREELDSLLRAVGSQLEISLRPIMLESLESAQS